MSISSIKNIKENNFISTNNGVTEIKDANGNVVSNNISDFTNINTLGVCNTDGVHSIQDNLKKKMISPR